MQALWEAQLGGQGHRQAIHRPAAPARPGLVVLRRSQGLPPRPDLRRRAAALRARFDRIFRRRTGFATLDRLLERLHTNKHELLRVLDRPQLPLNTNGSERDLRSHVIKCKISGSIRSDQGRECGDAFLGLLLTCGKLGASFWDFLGDRPQGR
jgi:Transposase IS66 family